MSFAHLTTFWNTLNRSKVEFRQLSVFFKQNKKFSILRTDTDYYKMIVFGSTAPQCARASSFTRFLDQTQRRVTYGRTPLDE